MLPCPGSHHFLFFSLLCNVLSDCRPALAAGATLWQSVAAIAAWLSSPSVQIKIAAAKTVPILNGLPLPVRENRTEIPACNTCRGCILLRDAEAYAYHHCILAWTWGSLGLLLFVLRFVFLASFLAAFHFDLVFLLRWYLSSVCCASERSLVYSFSFYSLLSSSGTLQFLFFLYTSPSPPLCLIFSSHRYMS